jgi:hypothetical protein
MGKLSSTGLSPVSSSPAVELKGRVCVRVRACAGSTLLTPFSPITYLNVIFIFIFFTLYLD